MNVHRAFSHMSDADLALAEAVARENAHNAPKIPNGPSGRLADVWMRLRVEVLKRRGGHDLG